MFFQLSEMMMTHSAVSVQPAMVVTTDILRQNQWTSGVCDCCEDMGICKCLMREKKGNYWKYNIELGIC